MIKVVTVGLLYRIRSASAHFLINVVIQENESPVEIQYLLVEKYNHSVQMETGAACSASQI